MSEHRIFEEFNISGKIVVITGAAGELCGTMASVLGNVGAKVVLLDINLSKAQEKSEDIKRQGGEAIAFKCDVLDESDLKNCYENILKTWGEPYGLINGAGGNHPDGSLEMDFLEKEFLEDEDLKNFFSLPLEGFEKVFALNFTGTLLPTRIFSKGMLKNGGSIINLSSMSALTPLTRIPAYSAAKGSVSNFTSWLAVHFAHVNIRVNALAPGFLMTEQLKFLHIDQKTGDYTPRAKKSLERTPMGRYGKPEELVGTVIWLLSDASQFVTGVVVPIDGGFSSYTV